MRITPSVLGLPPALISLILASTSPVYSQAANGPAQLPVPGILPTAVRKMPLDDSEKFYPEYVAFDPTDMSPVEARLSPREVMASLRASRDEEAHILRRGGIEEPFRAPFHPHEEVARFDNPWEVVRRAAEVLSILERRQSCPNGMQSCERIGHANKCCMPTEDCVAVDDQSVGNVACCPSGTRCAGNVAACPGDSVTCPSELGGGCCIAGFVCKGLGCVPEGSSATGQETTVVTVSTTVVAAPTIPPSPVTSTTTQVITSTNTGAGSPFRPTQSSADDGDTQTPFPPLPSDYCPVGYYPCLARYNGGCCQIGRDCETISCPTTVMTTIISNGVTIAVPLSDVPDSPSTTQSCASGWFLCGSDAGPVPGCCPDGYSCGTASCSVATAGATGEIQKQSPGNGAASHRYNGPLATAIALAAAILVSFS